MAVPTATSPALSVSLRWNCRRPGEGPVDEETLLQRPAVGAAHEHGVNLEYPGPGDDAPGVVPENLLFLLVTAYSCPAAWSRLWPCSS